MAAEKKKTAAHMVRITAPQRARIVAAMIDLERDPQYGVAVLAATPGTRERIAERIVVELGIAALEERVASYDKAPSEGGVA